jgi:hypothetical protein
VGIKFEGEFTVPVSREQAYALLSDPQKFAPLLPTYKSLDVKDDRTADVTVAVGVGKIHGSAVITLTLQGEQPPLHAGYSGKGKVMGSAFDMATSFDLADAEGGGTVVKWAGGLIKPIAKKDIERLVGAIQSALTPGGAAASG